MIFTHESSKDEFKQLTYPHMKLMYNVALRYCGNAFDAEDILQETYLMAFKNFGQLREKSKCKSWLLKILRNNFLKSYHKKKTMQKLNETDYIDFLEESMSGEEADNQLFSADGRQFVQIALDQLPFKYKEILTLYYLEELLYKDIADTLEIPIGTVMSRLTRAREGLKTALSKQLSEKRKTSAMDHKGSPIPA